MAYTIRLNKDDSRIKTLYDFSISTNYGITGQEYEQNLRILSTINSEEVDILCKDTQKDVSYIEIFDEENNIVYESSYWNTELSLYIGYNIGLKTLEAQRVFVHAE